MEDPALVAMRHGRQQLQCEGFDLGLQERRGHDAEQCFQVMFNEVHDDEHPITR